MKKLLIAILCTATAITLDIFLPITLKQIVAFGDMKSKGEIYFLILLISYCIMWVINRIIFSVREIFIVRVVERSVRNLSHDFFTHLYNLPMSFHVNKKIGDILINKYNDPKLFDIPKVLETPRSELADYKKNMETLISLLSKKTRTLLHVGD